MNKIRLKEGQEVWAKFIVANPIPDSEGDIHLETNNGWDLWEKPEEIMTEIPEKPVVPQFVADYIEYAKTTFCSLKGTISFDEIYAYNYATWSRDKVKLRAWMSIEENQEVFAKAWLFGYEVEQENLYYVNIPNVYHGDFGYSEEYGNYSFYNKNAATNVRFQLTESEIKENHTWAWKWAKPVEE
ncbi:DUF1642 domain-containing protein [Streptococcus hyovaginalis]|uniref:DUF1642 domain-containing protein n=1 Tax=Streptococcus hyovaginalis TaxID=149015 RepID=UPI002A82C632|nr:DUF1642 domain-containing protein [Streptococcus hyovaginalis]MDY4511813.1 DUF1642 domain-containing protein [Streptococcus hyovaginalis]